MAIDKTKVEAMIAAIDVKNLDRIVELKTYIPSIGVATKKQLEDWLKIRKDILVKAREETQTQLDTDKTVKYNDLSSKDKVWANKILAKENLDDIISSDLVLKI